MNADQKADMDIVCGKVKGSGVLDYVTGWYFKAAEYMKGTGIRCAFVSTNSISQGEQPGILWGELYGRHHMKIHFAHRTFPWESEARGKAHVHVVIIGFGATDVPAKFITDYDTDLDHPTRAQAVEHQSLFGGGQRYRACQTHHPIVRGAGNCFWLNAKRWRPFAA